MNISSPVTAPVPLGTTAAPGDAAPPRLAPSAPAGATFRQHLEAATRGATAPAQGPPTSAPAPGPLRAPPRLDLGASLTEMIGKIRRDEQRLDGYLHRARAGADFSLSELVAMQAVVHRYTQRVELLSKLVDRVTGAIKQTLQTPV